MLRYIFCFSVCLCAIAFPSLAQLTPQDLNEIRLIVKEENKPIKTEIESIKIDVAWLRGKLDTFEKHITWLIALIAVAVAIPPIVTSWRERKERVQQRQIESLIEDIEKLKQRIANL